MDRVGAVLCPCELEGFPPFDSEGVMEGLKGRGEVLPFVHYSPICSETGMEAIRAFVEDNELDRVVVACSKPELFGPPFKKALRRWGLNPSLSEVLGIPPVPDGTSEGGMQKATEDLLHVIENGIDETRGRKPSKSQKNRFVKRVMVIGGGITGITASIDLGNAGYEVLLVDRLPSIGGRMLQLAETFPTLDCAQCTLTPKTVETGHHPNIHLLTYSEVVHIEGKAGHFKVIIRKKPRYVDMNKCTGCADCVQQCPVSLPNEFEMGLGRRKAIYILSPQAVPLKYTIDRRGVPPCTATCPVHCNVQGYVALISQGKYEEALQLIYQNLPLPGVLGRICPHPCEAECNRASVDEPIAICDLKRFVADRVQMKSPTKMRNERPERVAIIGSGPAGLSAAHYLSMEGYGVTIFEKLSAPGGMLRSGIPEYRLPRDILDGEIESIRGLGVEIRTNTPVGEDISIEELFSRGYRALLIASGAYRDLRLNIPGEDGQGVIPGVVFLGKVNSGQGVQVGERTVVIGGGNVAIDAARSALRIGSKEVRILYRRSRQEMPADDEEIGEALSEGIEIKYLVAPTEIISRGEEGMELRCLQMRLGEPDATGRRRPIPIEGSAFSIEADTVIPAIGQAPDLSFISPEMGIELTEGGTLRVDPVTLQTSREGIFAGGDAVTGPGIAIEAVHAGREAAISIDRYLNGQDLREGREPSPWQRANADDLLAEAQKSPRERAAFLSSEGRKDSFQEVRLGLTEEGALKEAQRCLNCGGCSDCGECAKVCQPEAVIYGMKEEMLELHVGAIIVATGFDLYPLTRIGEYGSGQIADVIDGLTFERLLSASGPTNGEIRRPSDGRIPRELVFIQCTGSRDPERHMPYCSQACCMYTAKHARLYKHKVHDGHAYIFYMDIRSMGKGYEEFIQQGMEEEGILYLRGRVSRLFRDNDHVVVWGVDTLTGKRVEIAADMVVLATAIIPSPGARELAEKLHISTDEYGFLREAQWKLYPVESGIEGIYLAGCAQGPKDIADTVAQGNAAASKVQALFAQH